MIRSSARGICAEGGPAVAAGGGVLVEKTHVAVACGDLTTGRAACPVPDEYLQSGVRMRG